MKKGHYVKRSILAVAVGVAVLALTGCGVIDTGHVGVESSWNGIVNPNELQPGFYTAWTSHVSEWNVKESSMDLNDLRPKAKDNLSLKDLDVSVFYTVTPGRVADLVIKYTGQHERQNGLWFPAHGVISRTAKSVIQNTVSKYDSLTMHTKRDELEEAIKLSLQKELDEANVGTFQVTKVLIRALVTDEAIEANIRLAVQAQKELEQKETQVKIAYQDAQIEVARAKGIAESQRIINSTLTREYLQHEQNKAMLEFAKSGQSTTVMFPYGTSMSPMINLK